MSPLPIPCTTRSFVTATAARRRSAQLPPTGPVAGIWLATEGMTSGREQHTPVTSGSLLDEQRGDVDDLPAGDVALDRQTGTCP